MPRCPVCLRRLRAGAACPDDGTTAEPERPDEAGPRPHIPGFELDEPLGVGGAGAVWAARRCDGRDAAIKVAHSASELWRVRFAGEASALAALGPPHAPQLLAHDVLSDGRSWIAMERMDGTRLADEMARRAAALPLERGLRLADALLAAVATMHGRGIAHGDITPENIFLRRPVPPKRAEHLIAALIDFGLAGGRGGAPAAVGPGRTLGTPGYMAPEVLSGDPGGAHADVYALGVILYELFTLRPPFAGDASELERAHLAVRPPPPGLVAAIPAALDELILSCLAKDPYRRPPDAAAVRHAFADAARRGEAKETLRAAAASTGRPGARPAPPPPLVGRAVLVSALAVSARASFADGRPGLALLLGSPGSGKSHVVGELAAMAGELGAAHVVIDAGRRNATGPSDGEALLERARTGPLAVLVDDAHLADDAFLDSLEYATLGGAGAPLWVLVAADGRALDQARPRFGERAARMERHELEPLGDHAMRELAASLLFPADYLPAAVLDRLAALAGGNPGLLAELVRTLKREGAVRPRPGPRSRELAIDTIERLPATAAGRWEASRALDGLPNELAASARVAAAFGPIIDEGELDWVTGALEREGHGRLVEARAALRELSVRSLVVDRGSDSWAFASPLVQDAIYRAIPAAEREHIHRHALDYWRGRNRAQAMAAVARHAGLAGAHAEAAAAALALAEAAAAAHREIEAERWYSAALLHVADPSTRVRALAGRGRVRWRLDRKPEALSDLVDARILAKQLGERSRVASILLDEAMVLDWFFDFEASAGKLAEARPLVEANGDPLLRARLLVATGRTHWRQERVSEALAVFAESAAQPLDGETRLIALLLWASALCWVGKRDEAEATFTEAEHLAEAMEDRLHQCVLHVNRFMLWVARDDFERGADDLRRAVRLARELGHPELEWGATHNLAELLHFGGRDAEALPLVARSFELQQRYGPRPGPEDALLLVRIAVALGDRESAARHLSWVKAHAALADAPPTVRVFHRALDLVQHGGVAEAWDAVVSDAAAAGVRPIETLEILYLRAVSEIDSGRVETARGTFAAARPYADRFPGWTARLEALAARISV